MRPAQISDLALRGTVLSMAAAALLWLTGLPHMATAGWIAAALCGLAPLLISVIQSFRRRMLGVDVIALLAMAGALILGEYLAGAVISLMLAGGRRLEEYANARARRELSTLVDRAPRLAHRADGENLTTIAAGAVRPGDVLLVMPGEVVPVDGVVADTAAVLDEAALTGEAGPVQRKHQEQVRSGVVNASTSPFRLTATATSEESTYAGIIRLVERAQQFKAPLVRLADRYAAHFLLLTVVAAGLAWAVSGDPVRALAVLVVASPCPLILAAPIAIMAGISRAARGGIIVKGGGALETLAEAENLILDKTGTVTAGSPALIHIECFGALGAEDLVRLAASLDQVSPHVLAAPILRAARERGLELSFPSQVAEEFAAGIRGQVDGHDVALGKRSWALAGLPAPSGLRSLERRLMLEGSSGVFVAIDGVPAGALVFMDLLRRDAPLTLRSLRRAGFKRITLLTGDHPDVAALVGGVLGVDEVLTEHSPSEKAEAVGSAIRDRFTVMVGDGINDAPALAAADVGVALGARGATAFSEAADVVLVTDRLDRLVEAVRIARRSRGIALESIWAGMGLSVAAMAFAFGGALTPVAGAVLQELIDVIVIVNALRALCPPRMGGREPINPELGDYYPAELSRLAPNIAQIRSVAGRLDLIPPPQARAELLNLHQFLVDEILPHEESEDATFYPEVARLIGGDDPTAVMSRAHREIAHLVKVLGRHLEEIPEAGPTAGDVLELKPLLYGLEAILRLHFAQEDEAYLALIQARGTSEAISSLPAAV
jgi:heavy metal translocating P-type ATPase